MHHNGPMSDTERIALAVAIVLVDLLLFAVPLTGLAAAYILIARPSWFRQWAERLYQGVRR
jgi:hypothetical protein